MTTPSRGQSGEMPTVQFARCDVLVARNELVTGAGRFAHRRQDRQEFARAMAFHIDRISCCCRVASAIAASVSRCARGSSRLYARLLAHVGDDNNETCRRDPCAQFAHAAVMANRCPRQLVFDPTWSIPRRAEACACVLGRPPTGFAGRLGRFGGRIEWGVRKGDCYGLSSRAQNLPAPQESGMALAKKLWAASDARNKIAGDYRDMSALFPTGFSATVRAAAFLSRATRRGARGERIFAF